MAEKVALVISNVHSVLEEDIAILRELDLLTSMNTSEYLSHRMLPEQRRFLVSLTASSSNDTEALEQVLPSFQSGGDESEVDLGKLKDIKDVFDSFSVIVDVRRKKSSIGSASVHAQRAQSAPAISSAAKIQQLALGLHDRSFARHPAERRAEPSSSSSLTTTRSAGGGSGQEGIPSKEFIDRFASTICPTYPVNVMAWFNAIDFDGAGRVSWKKFVKYLQTICEEVRSVEHKSAELSRHLIYDEVPEGHLQQGPPYRVMSVQESRSSFFLLCTDGHVREMSKATLKVVDVVHYPDEKDPHPTDMKWCSERSQLFVSLPNGFVFVYDVTGHLSRQGNIIRAFRIGKSPLFNERGLNSNGALAVMNKMTKFDPIHMQLPDTGARYKAMPASVVTSCDVFPLSFHGVCRCGRSASRICSCRHKAVTPGVLYAIEPFQESSGSKDPLFFGGFESGHIALYKPPMVCPVVTGPRYAALISRPFEARVTCMRHCDTFSDLRGLLAASADGHLSLVDVETADVLMSFRDTKGGSSRDDDGGGWLDGCRPVTKFDVSRQIPLVASAGNMRGISLWSATMRRKLATLHDHRGGVISLCFNQSTYQLVSVGEDRTIRIWDIRTQKPLQVIVDRDRMDTQSYGHISFDSTHQRIVAWTGAPYVFQLMDTNIASQTASNLSPITGVVSLAGSGGSDSGQANECVAVASDKTLSIWSAKGELEAMIDVGKNIGSMVYNAVDNRLFLLLVTNQIGQFVFGSSSLGSVLPTSAPILCLALLLRRAGKDQKQKKHAENSLIVAGGRDGTISLFSGNNCQFIKPLQVVSMNVLPDKKAGDVTAICISESKEIILAGTSEGDIGMFSFDSHGDLLLKKLLCFEALMSQMASTTRVLSPTDPQRVAETLSRPSRISSAPLVKTADLWRRAIVSAKKETSLNARVFTRFRYAAQEQMQVHVDDIVTIVLEHAVPSQEYWLLVTGDGDGKLLKTSLVTDPPTMETVACFPASSSDGCGCHVTSCGKNTFWVGDDKGFIAEYIVGDPCQPDTDRDASIDAPFEPRRSGPKYFYNLPLRLRRTCRFESGISALTSSSHTLVVGLDNGRSCCLDIESLARIWGPHPIADAVANTLKHRFETLFSSIPPISSESSQSSTRTKRPPLPTKYSSTVLTSSSSTTVSNPERDASLLQIVMRGAPHKLRDSVVHGANAEPEVKSKADSLRYRDRSQDLRFQSCFSRLNLNDVSNILHPKEQ